MEKAPQIVPMDKIELDDVKALKSDAEDQLAVCARFCHRLLGAAHSGQALGLLAGDCVAAHVQSDECALINGGTALHRHRDDLCAVGDLRGISHISQFCHDLSPPSYRTS